MQDSERLWVRVLQSKYFRETESGLELRNLSSKSSLWKGLSKEWESMLTGARSAIRNGWETQFCTTRWVDSGARLLDAVEDSDVEIDLSESVVDYVNADGQWDIEKLMNMLPADQVSVVIGMSPPREESGEDQWAWSGEPNGKFSIKSAYWLLYNQDNSTDHDCWKLCWKWKGPNRIRHFLWLAMQEKLLNNSERFKRHMTSTAACEHCLHTSESVVHVLRDCTFATEVWRSIGEFDTSTDLWDGNCIEWLCHGLKSEKSLLFAIVCWMLWRARNERIFSNSAVPALGIAHRSFSWVKMVREAATRTRRHIITAPARQTVDVTWEPGPADWITVNSDGSFDARSGRATAGGLARYPDGRCIFAFTANLGNCSITRA
ncbi:Putative ribonuclease H protein At1g65750 [Linum perenne]